MIDFKAAIDIVGLVGERSIINFNESLVQIVCLDGDEAGYLPSAGDGVGFLAHRLGVGGKFSRHKSGVAIVGEPVVVSFRCRIALDLIHNAVAYPAAHIKGFDPVTHLRVALGDELFSFHRTTSMRTFFKMSSTNTSRRPTEAFA